MTESHWYTGSTPGKTKQNKMENKHQNFFGHFDQHFHNLAIIFSIFKYGNLTLKKK